MAESPNWLEGYANICCFLEEALLKCYQNILNGRAFIFGNHLGTSVRLNCRLCHFLFFYHQCLIVAFSRSLSMEYMPRFDTVPRSTSELIFRSCHFKCASPTFHRFHLFFLVALKPFKDGRANHCGHPKAVHQGPLVMVYLHLSGWPGYNVITWLASSCGYSRIIYLLFCHWNKAYTHTMRATTPLVIWTPGWSSLGGALCTRDTLFDCLNRTEV